MKKTMITTAALGLLAVTASGSMVSADMISGTTNKTDVTLNGGIWNRCHTSCAR